jgi:hypothetical protein
MPGTSTINTVKVTVDKSGNQTVISNAGMSPLSSPSVGQPIVASGSTVAQTAVVHGTVAGVTIDNPA